VALKFAQSKGVKLLHSSIVVVVMNNNSNNNNTAVSVFTVRSVLYWYYIIWGGRELTMRASHCKID
jgi:membrane protease YdiL (CAAX protease family)